MKVLIVDDEPLARERLKRLLAGYPVCEQTAEAANGIEAIEANDRFQPDIVLMDIRMPAMDGIEAARHITQGKHPPAIIFCTAYEDYAIAAFDTHAQGYLLKPARQDRLFSALDSARTTTRLQMSALATDASERRHYLSERSTGGTRLVPIEEVRLLMAEQKYVRVHHPKGSILVEESLRELESEFPGRFLRVHRNAIVALAHLLGLRRRADGDYVVTLNGLDAEVSVSRRHLVGVRRAVRRM